jgi:hypothetical protein
VFAFYAHPHPITEANGRFDVLPEGVAALCEVIQGLMLHPVEAQRYGVRLSRARWRELALRDVAAMLRQSDALADVSLHQPRPPHQRLCGNCRSFAVLLCAMLRAQQVPARVRFGFATYFHRGFFTDHVICEYWSGDALRWVRVDAMLDLILRQAYHMTLNPLDVAATDFMAAGQMWRLYHVGAIAADQVGLHPGGPTGRIFIQEGILHDLAALNASEPLCADTMLSSHQAVGEAEWAWLATLTTAPDERLPDIRAAFRRFVHHE